MTYWRPMRNICLALPEELILEIDEAARDTWLCRTEYIRRVLLKAVSERNSKIIEKMRRENHLDPRLLDLDDS